MKLTQYETDAMQSLTAHAIQTQTICKGLGQMLNSEELRINIAMINRTFDLRPAILEQVARNVEATIGVNIGLEQA